MFTVVAFQQTYAGTTEYKPLDAVKDTHVTISGKRVMCPPLNKLIGYSVCGGSNADSAYIATPSLRRICYIDITPIEDSQGYGSFSRSTLFPQSPIALEPNEGIEVWLKEINNTQETRSAILWLADGAIEPVSGEIFTIKATTTITPKLGEWSNGALSFRQVLPVGRYQVVGARVSCANGVAFRFVPVGERYRPGGVCTEDLVFRDPQYYRYGGLGVWFEFDSNTPPTLDLLAFQETPQTVDVFLDIMKVE